VCHFSKKQKVSLIQQVDVRYRRRQGLLRTEIYFFYSMETIGDGNQIKYLPHLCDG